MKDDVLRVIKEVWRDKLKPIQPELYYPAGLKLPDATERFLKEFGLPSLRNDKTQKVTPILEIQFFEEYPENNLETCFGKNFFPIARDPFLPSIIVAIDYSNGQVFQFYNQDQHADNFLYFVNSSVEAFITCLGIYLSEHLSLPENRNIPTAILARNLRKELKSIDAKAAKSDDYFWSVILEQVEYGLL